MVEYYADIPADNIHTQHIVHLSPALNKNGGCLIMAALERFTSSWLSF